MCWSYMLKKVDDKDIKGRAGHAGKCEYYVKYRKAVERSGIVSWLLAELEKDPKIKVKSVDVAKELGSEFANKSPTSIQWGLKYVLYFKGIIVATAVHVDGSEVLTFRKKGKNDRLPDSLEKKICKEEQADEQKEDQVSEQTDE